MTHPRPFDIERLSAGEVTAAERQVLDAHLVGCGACRAYFEELEAEHSDLTDRLPPLAFAEMHRADLSAASAKAPAAVARLRATWVAAAAAAALAIAGLVGILVTGGTGSRGQQQPAVAGPDAAPRPATIAQVVRASDDGRAGVEVRGPGEARFAPAAVDQPVPAGGAVRTDDRTRARLLLPDGTVVVLNHGTELALDGREPRRMTLARGELLADVATVAEAPAARFVTPSGVVEVLGTKLVLTATDDLTSVRVTRGRVRLRAGSGQEAEVKAGEEGLIEKDRSGVTVSSALDLASSVAWTDLEGHDDDDDVEIPLAGLGELRARRPGREGEREQALALASHDVRVRIQGTLARTEIEEVFRNDSGATLEGVYRFPLPADAQIDRLALDVEGRMEDGAFVERGVASKIFAGVIRAATGRPVSAQAEEYIWVPGPWRDPALLEWQRGGRFELRVFPIKARSERRVIIGYSQVVRPHGEGRRYVYPLAHSADASTRVGRFGVDIRVSGADPSTPVVSHGYRMDARPAQSGATTLAMTASGFLPAGDVIVDYALPGPDAELRWWTFTKTSTSAGTSRAASKRETRSSPEVVSERAALAADARPFVAFALRPELPARAQGRQQDLVIVVDSSQSMFGERFARATSLVSQVVSEMDRRDRFAVVACDATCRAMDASPAPPRHPSLQAAGAVDAWLSAIRPAGASDLAASLRHAASLLDPHRAPDRDVRVLYVGDGLASAGHRRLGAVASVVRDLARQANVTFTTVGVGGDADTAALSAIARAGGGHYVPYVAGQRASAAALALLETTYGPSLRDATLELPAGVTDVGPSPDGSLPTLRDGEELIVVGRFDGEVDGHAVLRGTVAGEPYEDRFPVHLTASSASGNAFVPRLWAAATIERLELENGADRHARTVALSQTYGVMSRDTSLLVLESEAMLRAFGVDRVDGAPAWTGEDELETEESTGTVEHRQTSSSAHAAFGADARDNQLATNEYDRSTRSKSAGHPAGNNEGGPTLRTRGGVAMADSSSVVMGGIDPSAVRRTISQHLPRIRSAYEDQLRASPNLSGRLAVQFTIGATGQVTDARVTSSTMNDRGLEQRILSVFRGMRFPSPAGGGEVTVTYPFVFQSAGEAWPFDGEYWRDELGTYRQPLAKAPAKQPTQREQTGEPAPANDPAPLDVANREAEPAQIQAEQARMNAPDVSGPFRGPGRWMRRVWERVASIRPDVATWPSELRAVEEAEQALLGAPDSRDRHRALAQALARAGRLERAREVVEQWIARDRLDPEALTALADVEAREGRRDEAVRLLSGVVDLQPDNVALHRRLADALDRAGQTERACSFRIAVAEVEASAQAAGEAIRCARAAGAEGSARLLLDALPTEAARAEAERAASEARSTEVRGDLLVEAEWSGPQDLDVSLVTRQGTRISWMGGRANVVGDAAFDPGRERLGLRWTPAGTYVVEVSRSDPADTTPVSGRLRIRALDERQTLPFTLAGARAQVGRIEVRRVERLVP
jgi:TonB family protein